VKTICIHQPDFAPYLGFFERLLNVNHFILLDDVQFIRRGWQHRDLIKTPQGQKWLTIGLQKGHYHQKLSEVMLSDKDNWRKENLSLLRQNYSSAPHFDSIFSEVRKIYDDDHERLIDFNMAFLDMALRLLKIEVTMSLASSYSVASKSSQRLIDLVKMVEGENYLTGVGSRDYLDEELFKQVGIQVIWQEFVHPRYSQCHEGFVPNLSCLDLFFNYGEDSYKMLNQ